MLTCGISGKIPCEPVITKTQGILYDRPLIERYLDLHHTCPVTGDALSRDDLLPLRVHPSTASAFRGARPALSAPLSTGQREEELHPPLGTLGRLQTEWEGMMLEQFSLRQQLAQTQQELSMALHKQEAACRVVARLTQQCEALRLQASHHPKGDDGAPTTSVLPTPVLESIQTVTEQCRAERKKRMRVPLPSTHAAQSNKQNAEEFVVADPYSQLRVSAMQLEAMEPPFTSFSSSSSVPSAPLPLPCTAVTVLGGGGKDHESSVSSSWVVVGTADGSLHLLDRTSGQRCPMAGVGHTDAVHSLTTLASDAMASSLSGPRRVVSGSLDRSVKVWEIVAAASTGDESEGGKKRLRHEKEHADAEESTAYRLHCSQTLRYSQGVVTFAARVLQDRYVLAGGGVHVPYLYLSDLERGDHVVELDLTVATAAEALPEHYAGAGSRLGGLALHPYGSIAGLLLHTPPPSPMSTSPSVVTLWDVKAMRRDTVLPITPRLVWEAAGQSAPRGEEGLMGYSLDFSNDAVTLAVGLHSGAALVWDLRQVQRPLAYLPPPVSLTPPSSSHSRPASVGFCPSISAGLAVPCLAVAAGGSLRWYDVQKLSTETEEESVVQRVDLTREAGGRPEERFQPGSGNLDDVFVSRSLSWSPPYSSGATGEEAFLAVGSFGNGVALCGMPTTA